MNTKISLLILSTILATALCTLNMVTFTDDIGKSTSKLVGVNCMTSAVYNLEDAAADVIYQIQKMCGKQVAESLYVLLDDTEDLTKLTDRIIDVNDNDCNNAAYDEEQDAQKVPLAACVNNMKRQMDKLMTTMTAIDTDITTAINGNPAPGACARMALINYQLSLNNFPTIINTCGSLTA